MNAINSIRASFASEKSRDELVCVVSGDENFKNLQANGTRAVGKVAINLSRTSC